MILSFAKKAERSYKRLPPNIQKKTDKQFLYLLSNHRHPSLRARKMRGQGYFEGRIDIHYRFTFQIEGHTIYVLTIGPHDEGLGKK